MKSSTYASTRGGVSGLSFCDAVMMGLADDGGLLVPEVLPDLSDELPSFVGLSYQEMAFKVMSHFIDDIPPDDLLALVKRSYSTFDNPLVTPLASHDDLHVLELFHGPTLAFKDVALQFLSNVFEYVMAGRDATLNLLGATSGDTGSAAIAGVQGKARINIFIMFPEGRTSELQERQMTSVLASNVHNLAIKGSFDDCQSMLKSVFSDLDFKQEFLMGAVNSVNWARILAQVVYYFSAWSQLGCPPAFQVAVPTGNFGNIYAGYLARQMGLPISHLILATNQNDILHRFFSSGRYERGAVHFSLSPAMDIQVASNFERYLHFMLGRDAGKVKEFMQSFADTGVAEINFNTESFDPVFKTGRATDDETLATIRRVYETCGYLVDPHTAVGITVGQQLAEAGVPLVCMATAHPAKFDDAITRALSQAGPSEGLSELPAELHHPALESLRDAECRKKVLDADAEKVKAEIRAGQ